MFVQGALVNQSGSVRQFVTPTLPVGSSEPLTVQAVWTRNGQQITATQQVFVTPGDVVGITLLGGSSTTATTGTGR